MTSSTTSPPHTSVDNRGHFSLASQRAILWWGVILAIVYGLAFLFLLQQVPLKNPQWSSEEVAQWYVANRTKVKWGAVICSWSGCFMMPIWAVFAAQMARVEPGRWKVWSALTLASGTLMSIYLALPPMMWGVAAYTAPRKNSEVTTLMHELASLTMTTTDQAYVFAWVAVTVIALRPATQRIKNNPFPRWWAYGSLWITFMFEAGAFAFLPRTGPFAWNGLLVFWSPFALFTIWIIIQSNLCFRAIRAQREDPDENYFA
jgi:hypothetical protein